MPTRDSAAGSAAPWVTRSARRPGAASSSSGSATISAPTTAPARSWRGRSASASRTPSFDGGQAPESYARDPSGARARTRSSSWTRRTSGGHRGRSGCAPATDDAAGLTLGTHTLPIGTFMQALGEMTGAVVHLVAIQAAATEFGAAMTPEVAAAVARRGAGARNDPGDTQNGGRPMTNRTRCAALHRSAAGARVRARRLFVHRSARPSRSRASQRTGSRPRASSFWSASR